MRTSFASFYTSAAVSAAVSASVLVVADFSAVFASVLVVADFSAVFASVLVLSELLEEPPPEKSPAKMITKIIPPTIAKPMTI
jgi:hypothetical protein